MAQLVAIVAVIALVTLTGAWLERGGPVARVVGRLQLAVGGFATGFLLALVLELTLWPGAIGAIFGAYSPPTAEQDWWAATLFVVIVGGAGAIVPNLAFRLGYAAAVLLVILQSSDYWSRQDHGWLPLLGLACWAVVAGGVRFIRWWVRPDSPVRGTSEPPGFWDGTSWGDQPGGGPAR